MNLVGWPPTIRLSPSHSHSFFCHVLCGVVWCCVVWSGLVDVSMDGWMNGESHERGPDQLTLIPIGKLSTAPQEACDLNAAKAGWFNFSLGYHQ